MPPRVRLPQIPKSVGSFFYKSHTTPFFNASFLSTHAKQQRQRPGKTMSGSYTHFDEQNLLELILSKKETLQNNPKAILDEIDAYGKTHHIMNVGPHKGGYLLEQLRQAQPEVIYEFGTHTGYSSILMATELEKLASSTAKVHTFDADPVFYNISSQVIALSGLSHRICQHLGKAGEIVEQVTKDLNIENVDLVFIDHRKDMYVPDLRVLEYLGIINKGTVLCADNVLIPGAPDYVEYVNNPPAWKKQFNEKVKNVNGHKYVGKWGLVYESQQFKALTGRNEMDALEVTKCVGVLN